MVVLGKTNRLYNIITLFGSYFIDNTRSNITPKIFFVNNRFSEQKVTTITLWIVCKIASNGWLDGLHGPMEETSEFDEHCIGVSHNTHWGMQNGKNER